MTSETEIKTVTELEKWLKENCYPMNSYSINGNAIYEGYGLENNGGLFRQNRSHGKRGAGKISMDRRLCPL